MTLRDIETRARKGWSLADSEIADARRYLKASGVSDVARKWVRSHAVPGTRTHVDGVGRPNPRRRLRRLYHRARPGVSFRAWARQGAEAA